MLSIRPAALTVAALLASIASACARHAKTAALPPVVYTRPAAKATVVDSVRVVPIAVSASSAPTRRPVAIHERPASADSVRRPSMYIVDGVILGRRDDGTIDHDATRRELARIDPRTIGAIQVLKGEAAVQRFGTPAADGVVLIDIATHSWRAKAGYP